MASRGDVNKLCSNLTQMGVEITPDELQNLSRTTALRIMKDSTVAVFLASPELCGYSFHHEQVSSTLLCTKGQFSGCSSAYLLPRNWPPTCYWPARIYNALNSLPGASCGFKRWPCSTKEAQSRSTLPTCWNPERGSSTRCSNKGSSELSIFIERQRRGSPI